MIDVVALALALAARPDTPGSQELFAYDAGDVVEHFDTARFSIHFTRAGTNAVPSADLDADGTPDHVQDVAAVYETVLDTYAGMGFRAPVGDGDGLFDVYLLDTNLSADGSFVSETCNGDVCAGYMIEENDFAGFGYPSVDYADRLLASHEFFHAVQAAYNAHQGSVLAEGTAVWASEHFDASLEDLEGFSQDFLAATDQSLTTDGVGPPDGFDYGSSLFWEFLSQRLGVDVIRTLLEASTSQPWASVIDGVINDADGTDFATVYGDFALATLSIGTRADPAKGFSDAASLPTLPLEHKDLPFSTPSFAVFGASYATFVVTPGSRAQIRAAVGDGVDLAVIPVSGAVVGEAQRGSDAVVDAADTVAVQIVNTNLDTSTARPHICIGSSDEVDACLASFDPTPTDKPPEKTPPPMGCSSSSSPSLAFAVLLAALHALRPGRTAQRRRAPR